MVESIFFTKFKITLWKSIGCLNLIFCCVAFCFVSLLPVTFNNWPQVFHTDPALLYPILPWIIPLIAWYFVDSAYWIQVSLLRVLIPLFSNHSFVSFAICLGSLLCWSMKFWPCPKEVADFWRFFSRISLYMLLFILPWITYNSPVPLDEKHPHIIMKPPPNLTVVMALCFLKAVPFFCQILVAVFLLNSSTFVSFDQILFSQNCIFFFS